MIKQVIIGSLILGITQAWAGQQLGLKQFLGQVQENNQQITAATEQAKGSISLAREIDLITSPTFFAETRFGFDEQPNFLSTISYDRLNTKSYSVGLGQQFLSGLNAKLSYDLNDYTVNGLSEPMPDGSSFALGAAKLELSMPLWANGFGRSTKASVEQAQEQSNLATNAALALKANILVGAESAYWRNVIAVEKVKINEAALSLAKGTQSYVIGKKNKDLGENSDVLQANAQVQSYSLRLESAKDELRSSQRELNTFLNRDSFDSVPELVPLDLEMISKVG